MNWRTSPPPPSARSRSNPNKALLCGVLIPLKKTPKGLKNSEKVGLSCSLAFNGSSVAVFINYISAVKPPPSARSRSNPNKALHCGVLIPLKKTPKGLRNSEKVGLSCSLAFNGSTVAVFINYIYSAVKPPPSARSRSNPNKASLCGVLIPLKKDPVGS